MLCDGDHRRSKFLTVLSFSEPPQGAPEEEGGGKGVVESAGPAVLWSLASNEAFADRRIGI